MEFKRRTVAPTKNEKWYGNNNPYSGTSYDMFKKHTTNYGNCTHYCYSRASEIIGKESKLPTCNAENWISKTKYESGKTPKLGSVIVYKHKNKSGGHVAIVEAIKDNGNLILSMSGYNAGLWWTREVTKKDDYCYSDYKLLGFIYLPQSEYKETKKSYSGKYPTLPKRGYFKKGDKGVNAKYLQELLNWILDIKLIVDGIIGDKTIEGVKKFQKEFQKEYKLTVDGLFGKKSLEVAKGIKK